MVGRTICWDINVALVIIIADLKTSFFLFANYKPPVLKIIACFTFTHRTNIQLAVKNNKKNKSWLCSNYLWWDKLNRRSISVNKFNYRSIFFEFFSINYDHFRILGAKIVKWSNQAKRGEWERVSRKSKTKAYGK